MHPHHLLATVLYSETGGISAYLSGLWSHLSLPKSVVTSSRKVTVKGRAPFKMEYVSLPRGTSRLGRFLRSWAWIPVLFSRARRQSDLVLHCGQVFATGFAGAIVTRWTKGPLVVYVYGAEVNVCRKKRVRRHVLRWICRKSSMVVTISKYSRELLVSLGCPQDKIFMLTPGFTSGSTRDGTNPTDRTESSIPPSARVVLSVSRLVKRKGHETVLRALPEIIKACADVQYAIAGNGPYRPVLEALADELGVKGHVRFLGHVTDDELPRLYDACDVFVMVPYEDQDSMEVEGFGIVYLEANMAGKPAIGSLSGGIPDAVEDGISGLLVEPKNVEQTRDAILKLLTDRELGRKLGEQGRARTRNSFKWEDRAREFEEALKKAIPE